MKRKVIILFYFWVFYVRNDIFRIRSELKRTLSVHSLIFFFEKLFSLRELHMHMTPPWPLWTTKKTIFEKRIFFQNMLVTTMIALFSNKNEIIFLIKCLNIWQDYCDLKITAKMIFLIVPTNFTIGGSTQLPICLCIKWWKCH